ncbi:MAG TPA: hypothetical protein DEB06_11655 [Phycisphaerales bacterium]|nr:hypothetical protein [Phycisphaerales bacterium]
MSFMVSITRGTMAMDADKARALKEGYDLVKPRVRAFVTLFYGRLFAAKPELRVMFPASLSFQKEHVARALAMIATHADTLHEIGPHLREIGDRHSCYGVNSEDVTLFRRVLLDTFFLFLPAHWTTDMAEAWEEALEFVESQMIDAMPRGADRAARWAA